MKRSRSFVLFLLVVLFAATTTAVSAAPYTVRSGDTLSGIAALFGVSMQSIIDANNIENPRLIIAGQVLEIPGVDRIPENLPAPAARPAQPAPAASVSPAGTVTYTVQRGDSLSRIAARFGANMYAIASANNITNLNLINVGQVLVIPGATGAPVAAAPSAPAAAAPPAPVAPPVFSGGFELGGQTQSFANRQLMREVGMTWVKFQHKWSPGRFA
jgi:LysM repeat protein